MKTQNASRRQGETESFVAAQAQGPSKLVSPVPLVGLVLVIPLGYSLCFTLVQYGAASGGRVSLDLGESLSSKYALNMQLGKKRVQSNNFSCAVGSVQVPEKRGLQAAPLPSPQVTVRIFTKLNYTTPYTKLCNETLGYKSPYARASGPSRDIKGGR